MADECLGDSITISMENLLRYSLTQGVADRGEIKAKRDWRVNLNHEDVISDAGQHM